MPNKPTDKIQPQKCYAKRHMPAEAFLVYDTMVALASAGERPPGELLICYAKQTTIANYCNVNEKTVRKWIDWLVAGEWLVRLPQVGSHGSNRYRIVEHDDFAAYHCDCPPWKYDWQSGKQIVSDEVPLSLWYQQLQRMRGAFEMTFDFVRGLGRVKSQPAGACRSVEAEPATGRSVPLDEDVNRKGRAACQPAGTGQPTGRSVPLVNRQAPAGYPMSVSSVRTSDSNPLQTTTTSVRQGEERPLADENVVVGGTSSATVQLEEKDLSHREKPAKRTMPEWVAYLWEDPYDLPEPYSEQPRTFHTRPNGKDEAIFELIDQHGEVVTLIAWAAFCKDPQPVYDEKTKFPASVFLRHADDYLPRAKRDWEAFQERKKQFGFNNAHDSTTSAIRAAVRYTKSVSK